MKSTKNNKEVFAKNVVSGGNAFCWSTDDLLRELILNGKPGNALKIYPKNAFRRKQLYVIVERYGGVLAHETKKQPLNSPGQNYHAMSHQELRAAGLIKRARGGCVPECCGWEIVVGAAPVIITLQKQWPDGEPLPESIRSLSGVKQVTKSKIARKEQIVVCNVDLPVLPREIVAHVFTFLSVSDVLAGCLVCKHWNVSLMNSVTLWKTLYVRKVREREERRKGEVEASVKVHARLEGSAPFFRHEVLLLHGGFCKATAHACRAACKHQHL